MDPVGAAIGNDVVSVRGMRGEGLVLGHANGRLMRTGNHGDGDVGRYVTGRGFGGTGGQRADVAGHDQKKSGMAPTLAYESDSLRRKLGQLTENALDRITGGRAERAEHAARDGVVAALEQPQAEAKHTQGAHHSARPAKEGGAADLPALEA